SPTAWSKRAWPACWRRRWAGVAGGPSSASRSSWSMPDMAVACHRRHRPAAPRPDKDPNVCPLRPRPPPSVPNRSDRRPMAAARPAAARPALWPWPARPPGHQPPRAEQRDLVGQDPQPPVTGGDGLRRPALEQLPQEGLQVLPAGVHQGAASAGQERLRLAEAVEVAGDSVLGAVLGAQVPLEGAEQRAEGDAVHRCTMAQGCVLHALCGHPTGSQTRRWTAFPLVMALWWACQDLNLGPHPYQEYSRDAF